MASTLREELASLKIDRPDSMNSRHNGHRQVVGPPRRRRAAAAFLDSLADPAGSPGGRRRVSVTASTTRCGRGPR